MFIKRHTKKELILGIKFMLEDPIFTLKDMNKIYDNIQLKLNKKWSEI